jgi:chemotaxis protein CheD
MKETIDVQIGEVKAECGGVILKSKAIGSCIAIVAYDAMRKIGAMAHVMLPGRAPANKKSSERMKYAADAIDVLVNRMIQLGSRNGDIEVVLVGGGNVLDRPDDTICRDNIESALEFCGKKHMRVKAQAVGGTERRSVSLDVECGTVFYSEGNGSEVELWRA